MSRKRKLNQDECNYIQDLRADRASGLMIETNQDQEYKIRVVGRGEHLFYQQGERALICEIQIRNDIVYKDSITTWDDGEKISDDQKAIILERIQNYFKLYQKTVVRLV